VVVTEWVQYRTLDLERLNCEMAQPVIVDLRNIYRPKTWPSSGLGMRVWDGPPNRGNDAGCHRNEILQARAFSASVALATFAIGASVRFIA
jgi:hypothetical protein